MTQYLCAKCGKKFNEPIWVADYHVYDDKTKKPHVWRQNPAQGRAQLKGYCPFCESDCLTKEGA